MKYIKIFLIIIGCNSINLFSMGYEYPRYQRPSNRGYEYPAHLPVPYVGRGYERPRYQTPRMGYEHPVNYTGYEYPRYQYAQPIEKLKNYFIISKITNKTSHNLVLKINDDPVLRIPAKRTVKENIILPVAHDKFVGERIEMIGNIVIATSEGQDLYYLTGSRFGSQYGEISVDINLNSFQTRIGYGDIYHFAHWQNRFSSTQNKDRFYIQLEFVEKNGKIVPADAELDVAASYK